MTQAQTQKASREEISLTFKRFILEESSDFASEPMADLYRVNLLGKMLDRYDELRRQSLSEEGAVARVLNEFGDIASRMRAEGFEPAGQAAASRWPQMTEDEAADYIKESSEALHRRAFGVALCSACCFPLMAMCGIAEMLYMIEDFLYLIGLAGLFGMVGLGVYFLTTNKKPKDQEKVKTGRFSLSARLREKLTQLREATEEKSRRRRGKGIAVLATCVLPILLGSALSEVFYSDAWPVFGVAGMFGMIGYGVYEIIMANGEKKTMENLLKD